MADTIIAEGKSGVGIRNDVNALAKAQRTKGLSVVSRINANFGSGSTPSQTADTFALTMRILHENLTGKRLVSVAPVYAHYGPAGGTEANTGQDWKVKGAIEPTSGDQTKRSEVLCAGRTTMQLDRRAVLVCDEVPVNIADDGSVFERTGVTTTGANGTIGRHQIARGGTSAIAANTGEGSDSSDKVMGTSASTENASPGYSCSIMLGRCDDSFVARSLALIGDSTFVGTDDQEFGTNAGGWGARAAANWPGGNLAIAGEKLQNAIDPNTFRTRSKLLWWHTDALDGYLINDVTQGRTVAQMKADILAMAYSVMSVGINYIKGTCLPLTDSTNGWFDVAGQTVRANEVNRVGVNQWLRDTSATGFVAQANAQVADMPSAGAARALDPCAFFEVNAAGVLTLDGGFIQGAQSAVLFSRTATSATTTVITDSGASYTTNALRGNVVHILSGTGAGQVRSIQANTATTITVGLAFSTAPDATSVYRIYDGNTIDGTHPSTGGSARIAAGCLPLIDAMMGV